RVARVGERRQDRVHGAVDAPYGDADASGESDAIGAARARLPVYLPAFVRAERGEHEPPGGEPDGLAQAEGAIARGPEEVGVVDQERGSSTPRPPRRAARGARSSDPVAAGAADVGKCLLLGAAGGDVRVAMTVRR